MSRPPTDPARAAVLATDGLPDGDGDAWLALPGRQRPRLLVRATDVRAVRPALRQLLGHGSALRRTAAQLGAVGLSLGAGSVLGAGDAWSLVGDRLLALARRTVGDPTLVAVVRLSLDRPNSKPVLQLLSADGTDTRAFVKVGWSAIAAELLTHEHATLSAFEPRDGLVVPTVLGHVDGPVPALAVSPLDVGDGVGDTDRRAFAARSLALFPGRGDTVALASSPVLRTLEERLVRAEATAPGTTLVQRVAAARDTLLARHGDLAVVVDRWHGDWAPANARLHPDGRTVAWDWERSTADAPVGLDAAYTLLGALPPDAVRATLVEQHGRTPATASVLVALALLALAGRHADALAAGHRTHDDDLLDDLDTAVAA